MKEIQVFLISVFITLMSFVNAISQTTQDSITIDVSDSNFVNNELKGLVLDIENQTALSYANIYVLHNFWYICKPSQVHYSLIIHFIQIPITFIVKLHSLLYCTIL